MVVTLGPEPTALNAFMGLKRLGMSRLSPRVGSVTEDAPTVTDLASAFGLAELHPASLTRFARVYRGRGADGTEVVVKVAGRHPGRVAAMVDWQRAVAAGGVPVVHPQPLRAPNPQQIGEDWWVVYPYVTGAVYSGTSQQIEAAGELLGLIHATDAPTEGLREYAWPETTTADVQADLQTLQTVLGTRNAAREWEAVQGLARRWSEQHMVLQARDADLPRCGLSSDFKANNLVWAAAVPTLVDPDNGGVEPRLFELAFVATMFHNECDGAPGRLLSAQEWVRFLTGYGRHVQLTTAERELWPLVFDHILWEEGTWALEDNDEIAWADPRQRAYLLDLAGASVDRFPLPPG